MGFKSTARFFCDGCKVIESEPIEVPSDLVQAALPKGWLRVQTVKTLADLDVVAVKFFCPYCARSVESYLEGRRVEEADA